MLIPRFRPKKKGENYGFTQFLDEKIKMRKYILKTQAMDVRRFSFTHKHMTGSRHHTQCPLKAETALRVPSSILLLMQKHHNTVGEKGKTQAGNQEFIAQTLITDAGTGSSETTPASSSHYKAKTKGRDVASRFWVTGEPRSAGFISDCKPEFPLRFRGPGKLNQTLLSEAR